LLLNNFNTGKTGTGVVMSTKLYVGNMSFKVQNDDLGELFAQYGNVQSATVITDRETSRSKGFGFVEMEDAGNAEEAIKGLNQYLWMDRNIVVNVARDRNDRPRDNFRY